jgi:type II secretory pathway pseudopilin PulG
MFNKIANLYKAIINIFDDELTELFVILIILGIFAAIILPAFQPKSTNNSNIENVEFVVDTLINDSEAVIKLNQIEIIVNNPNKWKENDTLILIKK